MQWRWENTKKKKKKEGRRSTGALIYFPCKYESHMKEPNLTRSLRDPWSPGESKPLPESPSRRTTRFFSLHAFKCRCFTFLSLSLFSNITVLFAAYRRWRSLPGQRSFIFDEGHLSSLFSFFFIRFLSLSLPFATPTRARTSLPVCSIICSHGLMDEHVRRAITPICGWG